MGWSCVIFIYVTPETLHVAQATVRDYLLINSLIQMAA